MAGPYETQRNYPNRNAMTPSDVSIDFSLSSQLGLSMSSTGTPSDPGDVNGQASEFMGQNLPYRPLQNQGAYMHADTISKGEMDLQDWQSMAAPMYAVSDPGEAGSTWQMNNLDFVFGDAENDQTMDQTMTQFPGGLPIMADEAVREWVVEPPSQMKDPNIGHNHNYSSYAASLPQTIETYPSNPAWI